jgi:hypothetical protein
VTLAAAKGVFGAGADRLDLPFAPDALVLWWTRQDGEGVAPGNSGGIGFWAAGKARAAAWVSADGAEPTRTARAADEVAVLGIDPEGVAVRARIGSGLSLDWEGGGPWAVHYLALGGLAGARAGWLEERVGTPFTPDLVLVAPVGAERAGAVERGLTAGLGAAGRRAQVGAAFTSRDAVPEADVGGELRRDAALVAVASRHETEALARIDLGDDGFRVDWERTWPTPRLVPYLALGGARCAVGTAAGPAAPGTRPIRVGFRPEALLLFGWGLAPRPPGPTDIARLCVGAATADAAGCAGWDDRDVPERPTATHVCSSTRDVFLVTNTQTGDLHAAARVQSLDRRGFTLDWTRSDGHERELAYVALASATAPRRPWARRR